MQQAPGRSRWLGWSGGTPGGPRQSGGGAAPPDGSAAVALRLLHGGKGQLLLLALTQAGLETWQVRAWAAMTAGLAGALACSSRGLCAAACAQAVLLLPGATYGLECSPVPSLCATGLAWQHVQLDYITA